MSIESKTIFFIYPDDKSEKWDKETVRILTEYFGKIGMEVFVVGENIKWEYNDNRR